MLLRHGTSTLRSASFDQDGTTAVEQASSNSHADIEKQRANAPDKVNA
jgi:hypothetical protein